MVSWKEKVICTVLISFLNERDLFKGRQCVFWIHGGGKEGKGSNDSMEIKKETSERTE